jgi:hypothetical protein
VRVSIASPLARPSPNGRRVGIRIVTFEACSGFTHVTARRIAQPPEAAFVTRLQPFRLPGRAARQLPDQSTTLGVESSSTDDSRLRGALPLTDIDDTHSTTTSARASRVGGISRPSDFHRNSPNERFDRSKAASLLQHEMLTDACLISTSRLQPAQQQPAYRTSQISFSMIHGWSTFGGVDRAGRGNLNRTISGVSA